MTKISNIPFTRTFNSSNLLGKELMLRLPMMALFTFSILAFLMLEKEPASISELERKYSITLFRLRLMTYVYNIYIYILISEDLALLICQSKNSLLKLLFTLKSMPRLIFKYFVKLSANIAVPSLVRWRPSFQTISLPISSLHMKFKPLVAHNTFSMLLTFEMVLLTSIDDIAMLQTP